MQNGEEAHGSRSKGLTELNQIFAQRCAFPLGTCIHRSRAGCWSRKCTNRSPRKSFPSMTKWEVAGASPVSAPYARHWRLAVPKSKALAGCLPCTRIRHLQNAPQSSLCAVASASRAQRR
eukprot:472151-Pleurochrysis_carterae.AAC.1